MAETFDYIVIGGGVMGASITYHLTQQRAGRVLLLERQALCSGTTARSGAIVRQHYSNDFSIRMAKESLHIFQHFDEVIGGDCGFTTTGLLVVSDEQGEETLRANVALQQELGVNTRLISPAEIAEVAPEYSSDGVTQACYEADTGVADPTATTYCFAQRAKDHGATIYEQQAVIGILTQNERVVGVETARETLYAPVVVIAANAWSVALTQPLGIALPITATRHPMLALRRPNDLGGRQGMHSVGFDVRNGIYLRPDLGGVTLVGATDNVLTASDPDQYHQELTVEERGFFHKQGGIRMPGLTRAVPRGGWAGIYDDTPDYHPILGPLPGYEGLYCAAGFSGHGFKLSPIIGSWMAQLLTTGQTPEDMRPFAYERFAQGQEIRPRYSSSGVLG
ncbi:oxidoreductase [Reticulibacter mediterranei]|uniref:Oxidoreductase n=1 Tax=Reticulibacter mediterranei TaxID=2778369 RepID=A0A8J3N5V2_9CHLR|nr:FAD-binding oxidoreductase [Reticulibacter mediterranei]GHO96878.1 oxidoreductase [Reticulibacter mediterranei]